MRHLPTVQPATSITHIKPPDLRQGKLPHAQLCTKMFSYQGFTNDPFFQLLAQNNTHIRYRIGHANFRGRLPIHVL